MLDKKLNERIVSFMLGQKVEDIKKDPNIESTLSGDEKQTKKPWGIFWFLKGWVQQMKKEMGGE